jgi:hypothetical protein
MWRVEGRSGGAKARRGGITSDWGPCGTNLEVEMTMRTRRMSHRHSQTRRATAV